MSEHVWHGPDDHADSAESDRCMSCVLSLCKVCRGAEASLPTECPGSAMNANMQEAVQAGVLDFKNGQWVFL